MMKVINKKGNETTIRTVCNDTKTYAYGVFGKFSDMVEAGILIITEEGNSEFWVFVERDSGACIEASTKDEMVAILKKRYI